MRHLLDVHVHPDGRHMVAWVKDGDDVERREVPFEPAFFVTRHGADLDRIADALSMFRVADVARVRAVPGLAKEPVEALRVQAPTTHLRRLARLVSRMARHRRVELWDVDVRATHQFLLDAGLWPMAPLDAGLDALGKRWDFEEPLPDLETVTLEVETPVARNLVTHDHALQAVRLDRDAETCVLDGAEDGILEDLQATLDAWDPDVVFTDGGDAVHVRYLHARAHEHGIDMRLGRDPDPQAPLRGDRSFWTYGQVKYQPRVEVLRGRLHLDRTTSFFLHEAGFKGLLDLSRITSIPVQDLARLGAGTAVTALQIDRAKREGRLVPAAKARAEEFKSEAELIKADRGGLTHDPVVGIHGPVLELDYASMYPNIMVRKNVSPETLGCGCCVSGTAGPTVPQLGWHTCRDRGFISRALAPLVDHRAELKRRLKAMDPGDPDRDRVQGAVDAMKWLAVCSFGYQGFKNARFGRIECHEAICAWGRDLLSTAFDVAHARGFEVAHAIVDSMYLVPDDGRIDPEAGRRLAGAVQEATGIPIDVEGWYRWVALCPTRRDRAVGALTRFFGLRTEAPSVGSRSQAGQPRDTLAGGLLKVRGVEVRQRSTPPLVGQAQEDVLLRLAEEDTPAAVQDAVPDALSAAGKRVRDVLRGDVDADDLVVTQKLSREVDDYAVRTLARDAAEVLKQEGKGTAPGEHVRFVVRDADGDRPRGRVRPVELGPPDRIDAGWYRGKVVHALVSLVMPMGWDERRVQAAVQGQRVGRLRTSEGGRL